MNEKCFCHLNGYRVKDSVARQQIEQIGITPQMYGAIGNGEADDTERINAMFNDIQDGDTVFFPSGTYRVSKRNGITISETGLPRYSCIRVNGKNNIKIVLSPGAKIKCDLVTETTQVGIFYFNDCNNIEITGGSIIGELDIHGSEEVNSGINGIEIRYCNNIYINDMTITNCLGDGILVAPNTSTGQPLENIIIENCKIYDCDRNGITYEGVHNGIIRDCVIYNITGHSPKAGIDLESEWKQNTNNLHNQDILITGCNIYNCDKAVIHSTESYDTLISNCNFNSLSVIQSGTSKGDLKIINSKLGKFAYCYKVDVENCDIEGVNSSSVSEGETAKGYFKNCNIKVKKYSNNAPIEIYSNGDSMMFENCVFLNENPEFTSSTFFVSKKSNYTKPYTLRFMGCTIYVWDNIKMFEAGSGVTKLLELIKCNFIYKTKEVIRPLLLAQLSFFKMIDCVIHCEEMLSGMSADVGVTHGLLSIRHIDENSIHIIAGNKIICLGTLKSFVTFKNGMDLGQTFLFNNISSIDNICNNTTSGTLLSYGNVDLSTLSQ